MISSGSAAGGQPQLINNKTGITMGQTYAQKLIYLLAQLKHVFEQKDDPKMLRVAAHEQLAEISKIMRVILEKYSLLDNRELLINASNLIQAVKSHDYENYSVESHGELVEKINALYRSFQYNIRNCLKQDSISMASVQSTSSENNNNQQQQQQNFRMQSIKSTSKQQLHQSTVKPSVTVPGSEDRIYLYESGLDELLKQAKAWSKYMKELVQNIEKRAQVESDYNRSVFKNAQNIQTSIMRNLDSDKCFLPLNKVYEQFCENEMRNAKICCNNFELLIKNILNPIEEFQVEFDKKIKKIKEDWLRENKQLNDALNNLKKSREIMHSRISETRSIGITNQEKWECDTQANVSIQCRKLEHQKNVFREAKKDLIALLRNLLIEIEMKIKEITSHYFETLKDSLIHSPEEILMAIHDTNNYEPGKSYREFADSLPMNLHQDKQTKLPSSRNHFSDPFDSSESDNNSLFLAHHHHHNHHHHPQQQQRHEIQEDFVVKTSEKKSKSIHGHKISNNVNGSSDYVKRQNFFGVPLTHLSSGSVPDVIKQCIEQIESRGSNINGIYRVSAVKSHVDNLCANYESNPNDIDLTPISPNVIANFLKQFFRMLPEPLLTFQLYPDLIEVATNYARNHAIEIEEKVVINELKKIIKRLPPVHYNTLKYLMRHLKKISQNSSINQMNPSNLGIVFGPTLLKKIGDDNSSLLYDTNHQSRIVELLILFSDQIFDQQESSSGDSNGSITHNHSLGSNDFSKRSTPIVNDRHLSPSRTNGESNRNIRTPLAKSATCSSIEKQMDTVKNDMSKARMKFFNDQSLQLPTLFNQSQSSSFSPKNGQSLISPFSQITSATTSGGISSQNHAALRRNISSVGQNQSRHLPSTAMASQKNEKIKNNNFSSTSYLKHNEFSKSSSDIFSYKNTNISMMPKDDHV